MCFSTLNTFVSINLKFKNPLTKKYNYLFDVRPLALVAGPDESLCHLVLDVGSLSDLDILLNLFATKWDVGYLATHSATLFAAF